MSSAEPLSLILIVGTVALLAACLILIFALSLRKTRGGRLRLGENSVPPSGAERLCILPPRKDSRPARVANVIHSRKSSSKEIAPINPTSAFWVNARARRAVRR